MSVDRIIGPKKVIVLTNSQNKFPSFHNIDTNLFGNHILSLRNKVLNGTVDDYYYRKSVGRDALLDEQGWLHLHIAPDIDNDVLLIAEQTDDTVIFIALVRHTVFRERPRGQSVKKAMGGKLFETKMKLLREASTDVPRDGSDEESETDASP
jgi:hypothetical protein